MAPQRPITWSVSEAPIAASAVATAACHQRVRASNASSAATPIEIATHGHGDGPGTHTISPRAWIVPSAVTIGTAQWPMTWRAPESRCTTGGSLVPM